MRRYLRLGLGVVASVAIGGHAHAQTAPGAGKVIELPTIEIVQTTPLTGSGIDIAKVPAHDSVVTQGDIARRNSPNIEDTIQQNVPGAILSNQAGSPFQLDLEYRGFVASPISGTPQGLAVYQNGVRINEAFGDIVNWDFLPPMAIRDIDVLPNNPAFGLNALGGAVSVTMKNGFTNPGGTFDVHGGSFGRIDSSLEYGKQVGQWASYFVIEGLREDGWRDFSKSELLRGYGDIGYKGELAEIHLSFTGADNTIGADGTTPVDLLRQRYASVYTTPQTSENQLAFLNLQGVVTPSSTLSIQSNLYFRHYNQFHVDGNTTDVQPCGPRGGVGFLCFGNGSTPALGPNGSQLADLSNGSQLGEIDRTHINTNSLGGTVQGTSTEKFLDHTNQFSVGASVDRGWTRFGGDSELGIIQPNLFVSGLGQFIDQPLGTGGVSPVSIGATNTYIGVYALDTFDVSSRLSITGGGRFNSAEINLNDRLGGSASGQNDFLRFNPVVGATYKLTPEVTTYAGYSEANRAPTPLELGCAAPVNPCILQNFLISDPPLKQVVARTVEAGFRGEHDLPADWGHVSWSLGGFRTENSDDILNIPSTVSGFGYFQNVGKTLRQGVEADVHYRLDRLTAYVGYSFVDAMFRTPLTLSSPDNPLSDDDGNISVRKGDHVPGIPQHRVKLGFDYGVTDKWTVGADALLASGQYLVGDASNQNAKLPGYGVVNLRTSYKVTDNIQVYGLVENLFDKRYSTFGTFFETDAISFLNVTNPRSLNPASPLAAYGGLKVTF